MTAAAVQVNERRANSPSWYNILIVLWTLFLGLITWATNREITRSDMRLMTLEAEAAKRGNEITILQTLRPEDRAILTSLQIEQARQGELLARQSTMLSRLALAMERDRGDKIFKGGN